MTHIAQVVQKQPDAIAAIFPDSGITLSFGTLDRAANQAAHAYRAIGLKRGDCVGIAITNRAEWLSCVLGAQRAGLYYVLLSTKLSAADLAYIVENSEAAALVISAGCFALETPGALDALPTRVFGIDLPEVEDWTAFTAQMPDTLVADPSWGRVMLYSSGTTGRPKGVRKPLPDDAWDTPEPANSWIEHAYKLRPGAVLISPSLLYHAAPHRYVLAALHAGASVVIPERFDAAQALHLIEQYRCTHGLWVPTMFHRMLQLPEQERLAANLGSMQYAIHGAAPCPVHVKQRMIDWWGPIIDEYYSGSEGVGFTHITSAEWLAHPGSVGRLAPGSVHILDAQGQPLGPDMIGEIYFAGDNAFEYWRDPQKTADSVSRQGWRTFGDIGYLDQDGYLYITDRKNFTIISGGVNLYPKEIEGAILELPMVRDVAVFGVPHPDFGETACAVVEVEAGVSADDALAATILAHVRQSLGPVKTPKSLFFESALPRHDTGKLYKAELVAKYSSAPK